MKKRLFCLLMVLTLALLQTAFSVCAAGESAQDAGTWVCSNCGTTNTGSFCEECGAAKPGWDCICGSHNEKKFCPVCGTSFETLEQIYVEAVTAFNNGDYSTAGGSFEYLKGFKDSQALLAQCVARLQAAAGQGTDYDNSGYNPEAEEGGDEELLVSTTPAPSGTGKNYAGATPVPIYPVDRPTPTPVPSVEFKDSDYVTYEAPELHLTFQGPAGWVLEGPTGWTADSDAMDTYILTSQDERLNYAAQIRIRVAPVNKQYSTNELTKEVNATRDSLRSELGFSSFEKYGTAGYNFIKIRDGQNKDGTPKYSFIKNKGVYTRYKGTLKETSAQVAGRIIINCYNKTLYILSVSYPGGELTETFEDVYRKVRDTLHLVD